MQHRRSIHAAIVILIIAILAVPVISRGAAQDPVQPPQPPQPKSAPPQKTDEKDKEKERKGAQRQGAQAEGDSLNQDETIKIDTDLVLLDVSVVDQNNTPIFDLKKDDFVVFEDRVKQNVQDVTRQEVPISFGMVIDTSGSMRSKLQTVTDASMELIRQMKKGDEAFIAQFKAEPELVQDFTTDRRELEDALGELFTSGGTALLDAIIATADYAQEKANSKDGQRRRRALVVVSDGLEKNSAVKEKEVLDAIKEDEVQIYLVGFIDEDEEGKSFFGKSPSKKAKELLQRLADDSGGRAFFPKDVSEMQGIAAQIAKDLRQQYVLSYYPSNDKRDGTYRNVKVSINSTGNRKMIARTRNGYYSRNEKGQVPTPSGRGRRTTN
ncbi:MAG: VWA domain-containing protein [Acidobacteria bacterium]|nr:VWA domain-containing protein [Acidobacteriota bacterium]